VAGGGAKVAAVLTSSSEIDTMPQVLKMSAALILIAGFALCGLRPAEAACQLIKATTSGPSKAAAAQSSRALAVQSAHDLKRSKGWSYVHLSAHRVKGDPFWKAVRPDGVPPEARLRPDLVSARFFTTCFTGVVVPYVCTTGSTACGR
jgi:hypothetical protein